MEHDESDRAASVGRGIARRSGGDDGGGCVAVSDVGIGNERLALRANH